MTRDFSNQPKITIEEDGTTWICKDNMCKEGTQTHMVIFKGDLYQCDVTYHKDGTHTNKIEKVNFGEYWK